MAVGPFDLLAPVGEGGMARVWAARVRATGQTVALKMLRPELVENVSFQEMFLDEARIASRVRHPNVCATYELGQHDGILYLAMEWIDGPSLMRVLRPGPEEGAYSPRVAIPPRLAARIVADACAGLHAAHELVGDDGRLLQVVHRDVSPHNLLLGSDGSVKVTDFGVAKAIGKSHMTIAGQIKGKLAYMSPEQLTGGGVDRRSDVFALGCVLYEITTAQKPFTGEHDPQVMASIVMGNYELPTSVRPDYPPGLEAIVMKALASDPDERYHSADALKRALEEWLRTSGPPLLPSHVAALLRERCADDLAARAQALEGAARALARPPSADTGGGVAMGAAAGPPPARSVGWLVAAVLVGALLGVGVLSYVRAARRARAAERDLFATTAAATASASAAASVPAAPSAAPSASAAAEPPVAKAGVIRLHITPPDAAVVIDGVAMPRGTDAVVRPDKGKTVTVAVRADKHDETVVLVDDATPDEVEIALVPHKTHHRRPAPTSSAERPPADDPGPEAPPNPYE